MDRQRYDVLGFGLGLAATAMILWITISGPPHLVKWQTLIAALVALGGGALAYRSAMAKVDFDRETRLRDEQRRRTGVYMRLHFSLLLLRNSIENTQTLTSENRSTSADSKTVALSSVRFKAGEEFDEAWQNLDLFPPAACHALTQVRSGLRDLMGVFDRYPADQSWTFLASAADSRPPVLRSIDDDCTYLSAAVDRLISWVREQIGRDE